MENFSEILIWIGTIEIIASLIVFVLDIIPKQIEEVKLTRGHNGIDKTAVLLLTIVLTKVFLLTLAVSLFICRRSICGDDFGRGYTSFIYGTVILLLAASWKVLYKNYKKKAK